MLDQIVEATLAYADDQVSLSSKPDIPAIHKDPDYSSVGARNMHPNLDIDPTKNLVTKMGQNSPDEHALDRNSDFDFGGTGLDVEQVQKPGSETGITWDNDIRLAPVNYDPDFSHNPDGDPNGNSVYDDEEWTIKADKSTPSIDQTIDVYNSTDLEDHLSTDPEDIDLEDDLFVSEAVDDVEFSEEVGDAFVHANAPQDRSPENTATGAPKKEGVGTPFPIKDFPKEDDWEMPKLTDAALTELGVPFKHAKGPQDRSPKNEAKNPREVVYCTHCHWKGVVGDLDDGDCPKCGSMAVNTMSESVMMRDSFVGEADNKKLTCNTCGTDFKSSTRDSAIKCPHCNSNDVGPFKASTTKKGFAATKDGKIMRGEDFDTECLEGVGHPFDIIKFPKTTLWTPPQLTDDFERNQDMSVNQRKVADQMKNARTEKPAKDEGVGHPFTYEVPKNKRAKPPKLTN